jgi:hypothetical protein
MKTILAFLASLAVVTLWVVEKMATTTLREELDAAHLTRRELDSLRRENERLVALRPVTAEIVQRQATEPALLAPRALTVGEWLPPTAWKNRGYKTPIATVETMLWAAARGDIGSLREMLQFDDATATKAEELYGKSETSRVFYASPQHLVAAFTAKGIPIGEAQLVWLNQHGADEAVAYLWINNPAAESSPEPTAEHSTDPKMPPLGPANKKTKAAYLTLHRTDDGWRVVVPLRALNNLARELGGAAK